MTRRYCEVNERWCSLPRCKDECEYETEDRIREIQKHLPSTPAEALAPEELRQLRNDLLEAREVIIDRPHLRQVRTYLYLQDLDVDVSPSAAGLLLKLDVASPLA